MREVFRGWRRKVGCIFLVMACLVCGMWVRSRFAKELFEFRLTPHVEVEIYFTGQAIDVIYRWETGESPQPGGRFNGEAFASWTTLPNENPGEAQIVFPVVRRGRWFTTALGQGEQRKLCVPYGTTTWTLTLLSAYLIFWKPRQRKTVGSVALPLDSSGNDHQSRAAGHDQ